MSTAPKVAKHEASAYTFGVEIECYMPATTATVQGIRIGGYHRGTTHQAAFMNAGLSAMWKVEEDGSLRSHTPAGHVAMEIISPVLQGAAGVAEVVKMVELLRSWGVKVNKATGLHVTVGHSDLKKDAVLANLVQCAYRYSEALLAIGASFARRGGIDPTRHDYATSFVVRYGNRNMSRDEMGDARYVQAHMGGNKYQAVNLQKAHLQGTVEFRQFAGTLNTNRMLAAIWSAIGMCQVASSKGKLSKGCTTDMAEYADKTYYRGNLGRYMREMAWTARPKTGTSDWASPLGVIIPTSLEGQLDKVLAQAKKDAQRMDEANAAAGYRHRVARPARLTQPRPRATAEQEGQ